MYYLFLELWPWMALAFLIGVAVAWVTCHWEEDDRADMKLQQSGLYRD